MRILVDYRSALRQRTGVGEYLHALIGAYQQTYHDQVTIFSSSWKDRVGPAVATALHARVVDRRIPVRALNYLWHRRSWPPVELLAGDTDIAHAGHPLLIPTRRAAQVITIHDLDFLTNPERTSAEIRRDYPELAAAHARRADAIITSTAHARDLVVSTFGVAEDRLYVCPPGVPVWATLGHQPNVPASGHILFLGTLEPRKNLGVVLDAYEQLIARRATVAPLVIAGGASAAAESWLDRIARSPLSSSVTRLGYVAQDAREALFAGARALVLPSLNEGFGLTALEAMAAGVPVIASNRGSLPEVIADGGLLLESDDPSAWAAALERISTDTEWATRLAAAGLARARAFTWATTVSRLHQAYTDAIERRR